MAQSNSYIVGKSRNWLKWFGLRPKFSEATLFLMSVSLLGLFIIDRSSILYDVLHVLPNLIVPFIPIMGIGFLYSFYHILKRGKKSRSAQVAMVYFGILISAITSILSGMYIWRNEIGLQYMILAAQNFLYGFLLFLTVHNKKIKMQIQQQDAKLHEVIVGLIVVAIIMYLGKYHFNTHWTIIFLMCIVYVTMVNGYIERWLPYIHKEMPEVGFEFAYIERFEQRVLNHPLAVVIFMLLFLLLLALPQLGFLSSLR